MTLALATRGYICLGRGGSSGEVTIGPGPKLVDAKNLKPKIVASGDEHHTHPPLPPEDPPWRPPGDDC